MLEFSGSEHPLGSGKKSSEGRERAGGGGELASS
jgi:hypothetical protein